MLAGGDGFPLCRLQPFQPELQFLQRLFDAYKSLFVVHVTNPIGATDGSSSERRLSGDATSPGSETGEVQSETPPLDGGEQQQPDRMQHHPHP